MGKGWLAVVFAVALIVTYMGGFNLLASFNVNQAFSAYSWYDASYTPYIIGGLLGLAMAGSIFGGTRRLSDITSFLVPIMAIIYLGVGIIVVLINWQNIPSMHTRSSRASSRCFRSLSTPW